MKNSIQDTDDKNLQSNELLYRDASILYGLAITHYLPYKDVNFDNSVSVKQILEKPNHAETVFDLEVDLDYVK